MAAIRRETPLHALKRRKPIPFEFVLDAISTLEPVTRHMFGCLGMWLATTVEHHESLRREFPNMRSIGVLGKKVTGWQVLPAGAPDFEEAALRACELVIAGDPRIGKVPKSKKPRKARTKA